MFANQAFSLLLHNVFVSGSFDERDYNNLNLIYLNFLFLAEMFRAVHPITYISNNSFIL